MSDFAEWALEFSTGIPVYRQIANLLYADIGRGKLREGDRLPTIKDLAERFQINPNTVARAYRELDLQGVIEGRRGEGSFVSATTPPAHRLTAPQKQAKLDEILGRLISEGAALGITPDEILHHLKERLQEDE